MHIRLNRRRLFPGFAEPRAHRSVVLLAPLIFAIVAAAGCGKTEQKPVASQVAAKVNADEITVHQINGLLARTPGVTPETAGQAKRDILDQLVDRQLAQQQAVAKKLDRVPSVLQALEAARSEILARAYIEQITLAQPKPTAAEVKKYYADHPELFAQRRVFNLEEIALVAKGAVAAELKDRAGKARSMQEIGEWLQSQGIKFAPHRGVRTAEQIPLEFLPRLHKAKVGEFQVIEAGDNLQVIRVVDSKADPVDEATAAPRVEQFLFNQRSREAIAKEMKQVKAQSKIEYVGEFARDAAAAQAKAKAESEAAAKVLAEIKAKEESEAKARAEALSKSRNAAEAQARSEAEAKAKAAAPKAMQLPQENLEKGVRGLR